MLNSIPTNGTQKLSSLDAQGRGSETELKKGTASDAAQMLGVCAYFCLRIALEI